MTNHTDPDTSTIGALAARYRRQTAPAGLTARVMAAAHRPRPRPWTWRPAFGVAAALLLAMVIGLPWLRDMRTPPAAARAGVDTQVLAGASDWLMRTDRLAPPDLFDVPDAMSIQSLAHIPDPLS